jgi:hypothetical protein
VAAGSLSQLIASTDLAVDGLYQVSTTLSRGGSTSAPSQQNFLLDVHAPAAPTIAPTNGQVIYGNAEPGSIVKVYDASNQLVGTVGPVGPDGNWTLIPATPAGQQRHSHCHRHRDGHRHRGQHQCARDGAGQCRGFADHRRCG